MSFADKLIQLRKKNGWSQEALAERMDVTRQSVSKWESAQAMPDLDKILHLSELFHVSIDYLLKDNLDNSEPFFTTGDSTSLRRVSMEEAAAFLAVKAAVSRPTALAVCLSILSPICLLVLGAMSELPQSGMSEYMAAGGGLTVLLIFIVTAVAIFISCSHRTAPYVYMEKESFHTDTGVIRMVKERREQYRPTYTRRIILGCCLCIVAAIPLLTGVALFHEDTLLMTFSLAVTLIIAGIGAAVLVLGKTVWESFEILLQEGDYTRERKAGQSVVSTVIAIYWLVVTAVFLAYSLITEDWDRSWACWPVAGLLCPVVILISRAREMKKR